LTVRRRLRRKLILVDSACAPGCTGWASDGWLPALLNIGPRWAWVFVASLMLVVPSSRQSAWHVRRAAGPNTLASWEPLAATGGKELIGAKGNRDTEEGRTEHDAHAPTTCRKNDRLLRQPEHAVARYIREVRCGFGGAALLGLLSLIVVNAGGRLLHTGRLGPHDPTPSTVWVPPAHRQTVHKNRARPSTWRSPDSYGASCSWCLWPRLLVRAGPLAHRSPLRPPDRRHGRPS